MAGTDLVVVWRATERCDTACPFCAFDVRLRRARRDLDEAEARRFGRLLSRWSAERGRRVLLAWLGGEPLLWPPLDRLTRELRGAGLRTGLTTGSRRLAEPRFRDLALEAVDELTVSLDGPPEVHDALRGRAGLARALLAALATIRTRRSPTGRPRLRVNAVLGRSTAPRLPELLAAVADSGADELTFNALGGRDRPEYFAHERLRPADLDAVETALASARRSRPRLAVRGGPRYLTRLRAAASARPTPVADCQPGRRFWFVEVDGRVGPCCFCLDSGLTLSRLHDLADLDAVEARLSSARERARPPECADCPSTQVHDKFAEGV